MANFKFVSTKTDGLGSRLKSILIAKYLANRFDMGFAFRWQPKLGHYGKTFHSVETADSVFSAKFIRDALIAEPNYNASNYCRFSKSEAITSQALDQLVRSGKLGVIVDALQPDQVLSGSGSTNCFSKEFEQLEFSTAIANAVERASSVELPSRPVAVHVRGGDIIYGPFKHMMKHQDKAVPLPLVRDFTEQLLASGKTPILFMQDPADQSFVGDLNGILFSHELRSEEFATSAARSMYDIKLMSRCAEIYSGSSRFSELASMLSGIRLKDINAESSASAKFAVIERECRYEARYSPEHFGFALLAQLSYCSGLSSDERIRRLDRARRADPANGLYLLLAICALVEAGEFPEAERRAAASISMFDGRVLKPTQSSSEVAAVSPLIYSLLRQCYSVAATRQYLRPLIEGQFEGLPVLSALKSHLRGVLGQSESVDASNDVPAEVPGLISMSKYLCDVRLPKS